MASTLRKRLRRHKHLQPSLSPNINISTPLDPIDLEANGTSFGLNPHFQAPPSDASTNGYPASSITKPRLQPSHCYGRPPASATVPLLLLSTSILTMFLSNPQDMLRAVLAVLIFAPYPPHFPRWTILVQLLTPMTVKGRLEAILFLGLVIWLHVGCNAEWWFVIRRLQEGIEDCTATGTAARVGNKNP